MAPSTLPRTCVHWSRMPRSASSSSSRDRHTWVRVRAASDAPELSTGRNGVEFGLPPGHQHHTVWLDPELSATFALIETALPGVAEVFRSAYIHVGGDEPHGIPHDLYASYVDRVRRDSRSLGIHPLGWQESGRAGLGTADRGRPQGVGRTKKSQLGAITAIGSLGMSDCGGIGRPHLLPHLYCALGLAPGQTHNISPSLVTSRLPRLD